MSTHAVLVPSLVAVAVLLSLSAFFSSSVSAIFSLSDDQIRAATETDTSGSRSLRRLRENPHRLLVTLLVGNNVVTRRLTKWIGGDQGTEEPYLGD